MQTRTINAEDIQVGDRLAVTVYGRGVEPSEPVVKTSRKTHFYVTTADGQRWTFYREVGGTGFGTTEVVDG